MKQLQLTSIKRFASKTDGINFEEVYNAPHRLEVKVSIKGTDKHITIVKRGEVNSNKLIVSYYVNGMFHKTLTHVTTQKRTIEFIEHLMSEVEQPVKNKPKMIEIKTSHDTVTGTIVREDDNQWILKDVTIQGIKEVRTFDGFSVPKGMAWSYQYISQEELPEVEEQPVEPLEETEPMEDKQIYIYGKKIKYYDTFHKFAIANDFVHAKATKDGYKSIGVETKYNACDVIMECKGVLFLSDDYKRIGMDIDLALFKDLLEYIKYLKS